MATTVDERREALLLRVAATLADLEAAQRDAAAAEAHLRRVVVAAYRAGTPVAAIARHAGVTRQTVYRWADQWQRRP